MDALRIGRVVCDYVSREEFLTRCREWLREASWHHVVTLNPEMVMEAEHNESFREAIGQAALRVPDGAGLVWARWYLRSNFWSLLPSLLAFPFVTVERITGVEAVLSIAKLCEEENKSIYLLGSTEEQAAKTAVLLKKKFPALEVAIGPKHAFDMAGPSVVLDDIVAKQPAALFVAYGAPKQAEWIAAQQDTLPSVRIAMGVGGAFAILSEQTPRAPRLFRKLNVEWLWRLLLEPERLPRIWQATVSFPMLIAVQKKKVPG